MAKEIKIGLLGSGTVGTGVVRVLKENAEDIEVKVGAKVSVKTALVRDINKKREYLDDLHLTTNPDEIFNDPEIDIVVEVMGGIDPAKDYMLRAMAAGKQVVTANKDVVAQFNKELFAAAEENGVDIMFGASVGGGIPIIETMRHSLTANKITEVMGIVNGTTNYMLTKMAQDGCDYAEVLKEAQEKGYAEADPTADVEGLDAARKATILASLAFNTRINLADVAVQGITKIESADIDYAKQLGYSVKLLAVARDYGDEKGVNVRVHPVFLPSTHPLSNVNDVFNAVFIRGNAVGELMFYGRGAGSLPTASAVVSDIVELSRSYLSGNKKMVGFTSEERRKFCPIEETDASYYVRLKVNDEPGVLGKIATAFGDSYVSLKSVIQTRMVENYAEIVAVTHRCQHKELQTAIGILNALPVVNKISSIIRVEHE